MNANRANIKELFGPEKLSALSRNGKPASKLSARGALTTRREKEGELASTSLEFEFHLQFHCGSPSIELSDFRHSVRSGNERECKQTLKNT